MSVEVKLRILDLEGALAASPKPRKKLRLQRELAAATLTDRRLAGDDGDDDDADADEPSEAAKEDPRVLAPHDDELEAVELGIGPGSKDGKGGTRIFVPKKEAAELRKRLDGARTAAAAKRTT